MFDRLEAALAWLDAHPEAHVAWWLWAVINLWIWS